MKQASSSHPSLDQKGWKGLWGWMVVICLGCGRETGHPCSMQLAVFSHSGSDVELSLMSQVFRFFHRHSPYGRDAKVCLLASTFLHKVSFFWVPSSWCSAYQLAQGADRSAVFMQRCSPSAAKPLACCILAVASFPHTPQNVSTSVIDVWT